MIKHHFLQMTGLRTLGVGCGLGLAPEVTSHCPQHAGQGCGRLGV